MKKFLCIMLVMVLAFSAVACGTKETGKDSGTKESTTGNKETAKEQKKEEPVHLTWITGGNQPKEYAKVIEELNKKSAEDIGVTVDIKYYDNEKTLMAMSTGEYFDIAFTCEWYNNYAIGSQKGYFADISEKIKTVTPDLYNYIPEVVWDGSKVHGSLFAIPVYKDSAATQYWTFDKDLVVGELGLDITTLGLELEGLTPILEAVKAKKPDEYPLNFHRDGLNGFANHYEPLLRDLWISIAYDGSTGVVSLFEQDDIVKDFTTLHNWYKAGFINPDAPQIEQPPKYTAVGSGQGFVGADAIWTASNGYNVAIQKKYGPVYSTASIRGSMNGVSASSEYIDEALKYLEYANLNKEYRNMLAYGIEGEHYSLTSEGTVERLNDGFQPWTFSQATFFTMYPSAPAPANQWELVKEDIQKAPGSPLIGFTPDISEMETEIAACKAIVDKYKHGLLTGAVDPNKEIPKLLEELDAAGYQKVLKNVQDQVAAFK